MLNTLSDSQPQEFVVEPSVAPLVLIVEDNPINLRLTAAMLHAAGCRTIAASEGASGLAMARNDSPHLILTDLQMSGMDGLALVEHLKADPRTACIPVIAVTAHAMPEHRQAALQAGCCRFISKPFRFRALVDEVFSVLPAAQLK